MAEQEQNAYHLSEDIEKVLNPDILKFWGVDDQGNITYKPDKKVYVLADELTSETYLQHYLTKADLHKGGKDALVEFYSAYMLALKNAGVEAITIDVNNPYKLRCLKRKFLW